MVHTQLDCTAQHADDPVAVAWRAEVEGGATTGASLWTATGQGIFVGRAACDSARVYAGAGDGNAYGYDAQTGAVVWSYSTNTRTTAYSRLINGPWYDSLELLPGGLVLVSTVSAAIALDAATGARRWSRNGSYIYAPKQFVDGDLLMIADGGRTVSRADPATETPRWTTNIGVRALNTGAAVHAGAAWVQGTTGQLVAVDLGTGAVRERLQLTTANCYSTPAIAGGTLVVGDQDGNLHGLAVS